MVGTPFAGRLITYMWGSRARAGTRLANPYLSSDGTIVVLHDAQTPLGPWLSEQADIFADYAAASPCRHRCGAYRDLGQHR